MTSWLWKCIFTYGIFCRVLVPVCSQETKDSPKPSNKDPVLDNIIPCPQNQFQCVRSHECILLSKVCDSYRDCDMGSDETRCFIPDCDTLNCSHCVGIEGEWSKCICDYGFYWDHTLSQCIDVNECSFEQFCDQPSTCNNTIGSFMCSCVQGYNLVNRTSCVAINEPANTPLTVFIANTFDVLQLSIDGQKVNKSSIRVAKNITSTLDFDHRNNKVCWISYDGQLGKSSLVCSSLSGKSSTGSDVIPFNLHIGFLETSAFAIDWIHGNWYFTDAAFKFVAICSQNGDYCQIIAGGENAKGSDILTGPKSIVVDPIQRYVYFADWNITDGRIMKVCLDGSHVGQFVSSKVQKPVGLSIDYANKHLYWCDKEVNVIERIDLSGNPKSRRVIAIGSVVKYIHAIAVFENFLYLTDRHANRLLRLHRYNYSSAVKLLENLSNPGQIQIYHRQRQPDSIGDPCKSANCSHICTATTDGKASCLCSMGHTDINGTCTFDEKTCGEFCNGTHCTGPTSTQYPMKCTLLLCPPGRSYCASLSQCLPTSWWCDGKIDCPNGDDEGVYCSYEECLVTDFVCASGRCIDMTYRCDGNKDCGPVDLSDELNCDMQCDASNQFKCDNTSEQCILRILVCDGHRDCLTGSDESLDICETKIRFPCNMDTEFKCRSGECISVSWKCDNDMDCADGSDEDPHQCADVDQKCNDLEKACGSGNQCIPAVWFCDGDLDCRDWSDESDKNCAGENTTCVLPNKPCKKDNIQICLKPEQFCNGQPDCDNASDENGQCSERHCDTQPCSNICYNTPDGFLCDCGPGEKLNSTNRLCKPAVALNKLCEQWGICGQMCEPASEMKHGYRCTCLDGFFLEPDGFSCKPLESDPVYVIFSNRHELRRVDIATSNAISLTSGLRNTVALDFYYKDGLTVLFWTDVMEDKIYRGTINGNSLMNVQAIVTSGLATTEGVAVDWVGENIYWVESSLDQIEVAKLDGSNRTTLIAGSMTNPRGIVLDPRDGALFWTDWDGHNPRIEGCSMSGENRSIVHMISPAEGGGWPNGLTVDYDFRRLYWIDARSESIHTVKYDGSDHRLVLRGHKDISHPFAISLFGNWIYWTDWRSNTVVRANKFNGSHIQIVQKTITQPFDLQVIHPKRQPLSSNPCEINNGGCSHLCLINYNHRVGCRCPYRMKLDKDGRKCVDDIKFLLFIRNQEIRGVDMDNAHFNVIPIITIPHVDKPIAVDYDIYSDQLYWADKGLKVINRANFTGDVQTIIDRDIMNIEGFAIDWFLRNMYFTSYNTEAKTASISVATLSGSYRMELINSDLVQPGCIALHPYLGLMFFTELSGPAKSHSLHRAKLDGSERRQLLNSLSYPKSLSIDYSQNMLYFINSENATIISCDIDGHQVKIILIVNFTKFEALAVYRDYLFVSTDEKIISVKKDGTGVVQLREATPNINTLLVYDIEARRKSEPLNDCHTLKSNCSQLCLPTGEFLSQCKCATGFDLENDNLSCTGITSFLLYAKETEIRGLKFDPPMSMLEALPPISQIQSASAVDFHAAEDTIYWVDTKANSISRIRRDLTQHNIIVQEGITNVDGLAVDWIGGNIYWTDVAHSMIETAKLNGSHRYVVISGDMEKPRSIVVDPAHGYLYWSDWGVEARIERARLDGSERSQYIYTNMSKPWGLTIDYEARMLYWCDYGMQTIENINLTNNARHQLTITPLAFPILPISLTVFGDFIYWIDERNANGSIWRTHKTNGGNVTLMRSQLGTKLKDIKSFNKLRQVDTNNCNQNNGDCAELCFYIGNNKVKCACSFGKLAADGKACEDYKGFLMFSKVTGIESINLDNKNPPIPAIKNETYLRNVIGLSSDYEDKLIFYSDIQRGDIQSVGFDGKNIKVVVEGIGSAEGLAYEKFNNELYFTSYTNSCISKINMSTALNNTSRKPEVVIQMTKLDHPRAIVVDSCWKLIYWTNWNNEKPRIQRSHLSGFNIEDIIINDIVTPNGLAIDHVAKKLYWSDARLDKIERCDMDGSNRFVIISSIPQHLFGLVIYGDFIVWTDWMLRAVIQVNKYDGTQIVWLRKNLDRQPMGIIVVSEDADDCKLNACHDNKFGCQDKCLTNERGDALCHCTYGQLKPDGKTCESAINCTNLGYETFACLNGMCLHYEKSCDRVVDCLDKSDENPSICANRSCPPSMFSCHNRTQGQCIAQSKVCNQILDCLDASDELPQTCSCPSKYFRCLNGTCISKVYVCDGNQDCPDGSDELHCVPIKCAVGFWKCKQSSSCIPENRRCDGHDDCGDKSDESSCTQKPTCGPNSFACDDGKCIYVSWKCDGDLDCDDKSDEAKNNCNYTCKPGHFQCDNGSHCILDASRCDGTEDCIDKSDELDCEARQCKDIEYPCKNKKCVLKEFYCDLDNDCGDNSDEPSSCLSERPQCNNITEFTCANFHCVDKDFYCDQDDDCGDASDEPATCPHAQYIVCTYSEFQCDDSHCIDKSRVCDGNKDCADGKDESACNFVACDPKGNDDIFQCANGVCILSQLVCNQRHDCGDGSDEVAACGFNECVLLRPCSQICEDKPLGFRCKCNVGFKLRGDNYTCEDIDECLTEYPCTHSCINTLGSYYCQCAESYKLVDDKKHCDLDADEERPSVFISNRHYIRKVDFDGTNDKIILDNLTHSVAIDFDYMEQYLYWTDILSDSSAINRIPINATSVDQKQVLHSSTVLNPDGMAVDWVGRNLYWCDRNTDTVEVSRLDGKYRKILLKDKSFLREPRALEIFPKYGYLFLSDWGDKPHISRMSMDGKSKKHIVTESLAWPNALTIDYVMERLFWADANHDYIAMCDLNGDNRRVVIRDHVPHVFALTTFMEYIFWTDWELHGVYRAEKFTGEKVTLLLQTTHRPMDLVVYHKLRQPKMKINPCLDLNCTHLCLLRPSTDGLGANASCACPENHVLNEDKMSCTASCDKAQFLCASNSKCIPIWWKCDKHIDCEDHSDEPNSCGPYYCRQSGLFQCANAKNESGCIPPIFICDGKAECTDGSDEKQFNNCIDYPCISHQHKCKRDNICISDLKVCDGKRDCSDGEDELDCAKQECLDTQFRCNTTGNCIPYLWQCDGDNDCGDGFDESNCTDRTCKPGYLKCNRTEKCIPMAWKCDGELDCGFEDSTDEAVAECSQVTCDPTNWRCGNNHCIPDRWHCDDDKDCSDGSDELNCKTCSANEWKCLEGNKCIPFSSKCNGRIDCKDMSDEHSCTINAQCSSSEFKCQHFGCIPMSWKCDGDEDCLDGSDEHGCKTSCQDGWFSCLNNSNCISLLWRCDNQQDCEDGSDELDCKALACPVGRFRCQDGKCIPHQKKCNGVPDCNDSSDESPKMCKVKQCSLTEFRCYNNMSCIKLSKMCDGQRDCSDGSDESADICNSMSSCGLLRGGCSHNCTYLSKIQKVKCSCLPGYEVDDDGITCVYYNPCDTWGTCPQLCSYSRASNKILCLCEQGYYKSLNKGSVTCLANGTKTTLLIAEENQITERNIHTISHENTIGRIISENESKIASVKVDSSSSAINEWQLFVLYTNKKLIATRMLDYTKDESANRNKQEIGVSHKEETVISGLNEPRNLAIDWIGKTIYWTDTSTRKIEMCKYNGTRRRTVIKEHLDEPWGIAVDPNFGKLFWTDRGYPPKIESSNLDGSNHTIIVSLDLSWPSGIALDYPNQRLYWTDTKIHTIETVDYQGKDRHIVITFNASDPPYLIDVFEDALYVTTFKHHKVLKVPKFYNSTNHQIEEMTGAMLHIGDLVIYQSSKQIIKNTNITNACSIQSCVDTTQMCINNPFGKNGKRYSCVCSDGAVFSEVDKKCNFMQCPDSYCLYGGICSTTQSNEFKCSCRLGFTGKQCEIDVCRNYCAVGGTCTVSELDPINPKCSCPPFYMGQRCENYTCSGHCLNNGLCMIHNGTLFCWCMDGFTGPTCEFKMARNCSCENNGTCVSELSAAPTCTCPPGFTGSRCEKCLSITCANNGICTKDGQRGTFHCKCPPGYDPRYNCTKVTCNGYCLNNAECSVIDKSIRCKCQIGYSGPRCEAIVTNCGLVTCQNGGNCIRANTTGPVQCDCRNGYTGSYCEINSCNGFCKNGGNCSFGNDSQPICTCPNLFQGRMCEKCLCANGGACTVAVNGQAVCKCSSLFKGQFCNRSICHDWCYNSGECVNCHLEDHLGICSQCKCKEHTSGKQCQVLEPPKHGDMVKSAGSALIPIVISVVIGVCILLTIVIFVVIKNTRNQQFRHSRLIDPTNVHVSNPIYMPQTTEEEDEQEDESHQPLRQTYDFDPEKSTNFANPVYEQFYKDSRQKLIANESDDDEHKPINGTI